MSPELRAWLLDCPTLTAVSTLALGAGACGLIDLGNAIASAVSADVRIQTLRLPGVASRPRLRWSARLAFRQPRLRLHIVGGTAVLSGFLGNGGVISQTRNEATLYVATPLQDAIIAALPGRPLTALVTAPLLDLRDYVIEAASTSLRGTEASFKVQTLPIAGVRATIPRLIPGPAARRGPAPARPR